MTLTALRLCNGNLKMPGEDQHSGRWTARAGLPDRRFSGIIFSRWRHRTSSGLCSMYKRPDQQFLIASSLSPTMLDHEVIATNLSLRPSKPHSRLALILKAINLDMNLAELIEPPVYQSAGSVVKTSITQQQKGTLTRDETHGQSPGQCP